LTTNTTVIMADDSSAPIWLLLRAARDLVVSHSGVSVSEAERLIIKYAQNGHFTTVRFDGSHIPPSSWGASYPEQGLFILADFDNSTVRYSRTEPISDMFTPNVARKKMWELERTLGEFLPPPRLEMHLVRLAQHQVLSMLNKAGLRTQVVQVVSSPKPTSAPLPPESERSPAEASSTSSVEAPEGVSKPKPAVKPVSGSVWLRAAVKRWGRPDKIDSVPKGITEFAGILKAEMIEAHARGEVKLVFDADSDETRVMQLRLHDYKLWPVKRSR
jgi:hypothetical protein